jgi:FixJ family two-component response regulator
MTNPLAIVVEDDAQQLEFTRDLLVSIGFEVHSFTSISATTEYLDDSDDQIDLFVLDRRLPVVDGDVAADEIGDELLNVIRGTFPDTRIIVFTGHADILHAQTSLQGGGQIPARGNRSVDRITHLEKDQTIEFEETLTAYRELLQELDDIEVICDEFESLSDFDKRVLRRLAFHYEATSVEVLILVGGLTGAGVWRCVLRNTNGPIAEVVAKSVKKPGTTGGLPQLLSRIYVVATLATISGHMNGRYINVLQNAGTSTVALMDKIEFEEGQAVDLVLQVCRELGEVHETAAVVDISTICTPLIEWDALQALLERHGVTVPHPSLKATVKIGLRHGDLHPSNILISNEQAVLIDFDSSEPASSSLDPITLLLSTLVHPTSPIRGDLWPSVDDIHVTFGTGNFGRGHSHELWFGTLTAWALDRRAGERDFWTVVLAYCARQFQYPNIASDPAVMERLLELAKKASESLCNS